MKKREQKYLTYIGVGTFFLLLILYTSGGLNFGKIQPEELDALSVSKGNFKEVENLLREVPAFESAVGSIASQRGITVSAQVTGQVQRVAVEPGSEVKQDDILIELDARELSARFKKVKAHYKRIKGYVDKQAATKESLESAESAYRQAQAALSYTKMAAPFSGIVSRKLVEPGDLAWPGKPLVELYDPALLRLEAQVREGLISKLTIGNTYQIDIPAAGAKIAGTLQQIIPSADPGTRTFLVRVGFAPKAGIYPGMFGSLQIPLGKKKTIFIPREALIRVGQLEQVMVKEGEFWKRRLVTTGEEREGGRLEVLSGLDGNEIVGMPRRQNSAKE